MVKGMVNQEIITKTKIPATVKTMRLSLIFNKLSPGLIILKVLKREEANLGKVIKPLTIVSLNNFARFETYPRCFPNDRIFAITKSNPVNTERLTCLPVTAVRKNIPFNRKRFFTFHHFALYNYCIKKMLSFPDIVTLRV